MSHTKRGRRLCGNCGRVSQVDLARNYCPVTCRSIRPNKPADGCRFYDGDGDGDGREGKDNWRDRRRR